jgi:hypothetical protein
LKVRSFAIALAASAVLASGCSSSSDDDVSALEDRIAELEASTTTTTLAPTTTTTTTTLASTTTTIAGLDIRSAWESTLGVFVLGTGDFDDFTASDVVESAYLLCENLVNAESPVMFTITVAASDDPLFTRQFSTLLGVIQVAPGCKTERQRLAAKEAFEFLQDL